MKTLYILSLTKSIQTSGALPSNVLVNHRKKKPAARLPRTPPSPPPPSLCRHGRKASRTTTISSDDASSEDDNPVKRKKSRSMPLEPKSGTMAFYSADIQACLEAAKDQFRLTLCSLDTMPSSLQSYDRARDAIRAEATCLNMGKICFNTIYRSNTSNFIFVDFEINNHMIQLVRQLVSLIL